LSFSAAVVSSSFTASNSVIVGIRPSTNQFTGGEGPVTGQKSPSRSRSTRPSRSRPVITLPARGAVARPGFSGSRPRPIAPRYAVPAGVTDLQSCIATTTSPDCPHRPTSLIKTVQRLCCPARPTRRDGVPDSRDHCPTRLPADWNADGRSIINWPWHTPEESWHPYPPWRTSPRTLSKRAESPRARGARFFRRQLSPTAARRKNAEFRQLMGVPSRDAHDS
jgi:hypothetical protein